jgi:hypothetical protein
MGTQKIARIAGPVTGPAAVLCSDGGLSIAVKSAGHLRNCMRREGCRFGNGCDYGPTPVKLDLVSCAG